MVFRITKAFLLLVGVSGVVFLLIFSPYFSGLSSSYVNVVNNLNLYPQEIKGQKKESSSQSNQQQSKESFRSHNKDSDVKLVEEEKVLSQPVTATPKPFDELPPATKKEVSKGTEAEKKKHGKDEMKSCSNKGSNLVGPLFIDQSIPKDMVSIEKTLSVEYGGTVEKGGLWYPSTCKPIHKVAIIIPYRKRFEQLKIFLRHMHPFLQRQEIYYRIIVVEQLHDDPFNRAGLFNVGFTEALKLADFDCFIFTDVDLLPEDDHNYYGCPTSPRHMSVAVDKFNYRLPYSTIFGGVGAFTKDHFERINGFSNLFWGWGGEDDDLYARITRVGFKLTRPSLKIGRYTMIRIHHFQSSKADPNRMNLLKNSGRRMTADGLNTLKYKLEKVDELPLVTFVKIQLKRSMYT